MPAKKLPKAVKTGPNPTDQYVGSRVRMRRIMVGLSQEKVAHALGLTFQQVQKYEKGTNRISSSRLHQLAKILEVPIPFFFDGAPQQSVRSPSQTEAPNFVSDFLATHDGLRLITAFIGVEDAKLRRRIVDLVEQARLGYATWFAIAIAAGLVLVMIMLWPMVEWLR